jgi:hypothetical protein
MPRRFAFHIREDPIQSAIVQTFAYMGRPDVRLVHVPNELADTDAKRIRQARLGMWAGCPDLLFITPAGEPIAFIECKASGKNVARRGVQADARTWILAAGHNWALVNDPNQIIPTLTALGLLRLNAATGGL